jgi:hypothetical protein
MRDRNTYRILVEVSGRCRCRWEDNIKLDLRVIGGSNMDLIDQAQDRDQ